MSETNLHLIAYAETNVALNAKPKRRIIGEMVREALFLSRSELSSGEGLGARYRIGDYLFCEPDYQQVLLWSHSLSLEPSHVVQRLLAEPEPDWWAEMHCKSPFKTEISNGRFESLYLQGDLLPLESFEWVDGLVFRSLAYRGSPKHGNHENCALSLRLPNLQRLFCAGLNLRSLDLNGAPNLEALVCGESSLSDLDLRPVPKLKGLVIKKSKLSDLNLSTVPALAGLVCENNFLTKLDLSGVPQLTMLRCGGNQLTQLELSATFRLTNLQCERNQITRLDLTALEQLALLDASDNQIRELIFPKLLSLRYLLCSGNQLTKLNLSSVPNLVSLYCIENQLTELNLSAVPLLKVLCCSFNHLAKLDMQAVPLLTCLSCDGNELPSVDLSSAPLLSNLSCDGEVLKKLNLSTWPLLTEVQCDSHRLTELELSVVKDSQLSPGDETSSAEHLFQIAEANYYGWGGPQNYAEAVSCYRVAAKLGHLDAACNLGYMLTLGLGVAQNNEEAALWFEAAAAKGHPVGFFNLSHHLESGLGKPSDSDAAYWLYRSGEKRNNPTGDLDSPPIRFSNERTRKFVTFYEPRLPSLESLHAMIYKSTQVSPINDDSFTHYRLRKVRLERILSPSLAGRVLVVDGGDSGLACGDLLECSIFGLLGRWVADEGGKQAEGLIFSSEPREYFSLIRVETSIVGRITRGGQVMLNSNAYDLSKTRGIIDTLYERGLGLCQTGESSGQPLFELDSDTP